MEQAKKGGDSGSGGGPKSVVVVDVFSLLVPLHRSFFFFSALGKLKA